MAKILVLDDDPEIVKEFSSFITEMGHMPLSSTTIDEALDIIDALEEDSEQPDLFVLDHYLENGDFAIHLLKILDQENPEIYKDRFIVVTGHAKDDVTESYTDYGSADHLIKPVHEAQFKQTVNRVLRKIELNSLQEAWETAYRVLEDEGILDSLEMVNEENSRINNDLITLQALYNDLIEKTKKSSDRELALAYEKAYDALNKIEGKFEILKKYQNVKFKFSVSFIEDVKKVYNINKVLFFNLVKYLERIQESPLSHRIKSLEPSAPNTYEYRVGRSHRLYFRKSGDTTVFIRFGDKNIQQKILSNMSNREESPITTL